MAWWCNGYGIGQVIERSWTTLGKLFTHICLSPSSIIWYRPTRWKVTPECWRGVAYHPRNWAVSAPYCWPRVMWTVMSLRSQSCERAMLTMDTFTFFKYWHVMWVNVVYWCSCHRWQLIMWARVLHPAANAVVMTQLLMDPSLEIKAVMSLCGEATAVISWQKAPRRN